MKKINININKPNTNSTLYNVKPIFMEFSNQLDIKILVDKSINIMDKIKEFHDDISSTTSLTICKIVKYIYSLECLYIEITQSLMILWWNIKITYENSNLSAYQHLELDRLLSNINKFHSYFESSKNCIEIGIDLIIGVNRSNQFVMLLTNKFVNEMILVIMQYYYITKWLNYVLINNTTILSIFGSNSKILLNNNLANMFS